MTCSRCQPRPLSELLASLAAHRAAREDAMRRRSDALAAYEAAVRDLERAERRVDGVTRDVEARLEAYRRVVGRSLVLAAVAGEMGCCVAHKHSRDTLCGREVIMRSLSGAVHDCAPCSDAVDAVVGGQP